MNLEKHMQIVTSSHCLRQKEEERALQKVWEGFDKEEKGLTDIVRDAFGKVLEEIELIVYSSVHANKDNTAEILDYDISYYPKSRKFRIKITKFKLPDGKIMDDEDICSSQHGCPHGYLKHEEITKFMKNYHVDYIEEPNNDCEHK